MWFGPDASAERQSGAAAGQRGCNIALVLFTSKGGFCLWVVEIKPQVHMNFLLF